MKADSPLVGAFYLAVGALLLGVAALFVPLVARDAWWLIAVAACGLPALGLLLTGAAQIATALDDLLCGARERHCAVDQAEATAEAQYWLAVARAQQLGIPVAGYLRHAGWTAAAIAELELATQRDIDEDGTIGPVPVNDYRDPRVLARNRVLAFVERAWRLTVEAGGDPRHEALGLARSQWCPDSSARDRERQEYDAILEVLQRRPLALVFDRSPGKPGRFAVATVDEALETVRALWPYVTVPPILLEQAGATHPTPASQVVRGAT